MTVIDPNCSREASYITSQPTYLNSFKIAEALLLTRSIITAHTLTLVTTDKIQVSWSLGLPIRRHQNPSSQPGVCLPLHFKKKKKNSFMFPVAPLTGTPPQPHWHASGWGCTVVFYHKRCVLSLTITEAGLCWPVLQLPSSAASQPPPSPRNWGKGLPDSNCIKKHLKLLTPTNNSVAQEQQRNSTQSGDQGKVQQLWDPVHCSTYSSFPRIMHKLKPQLPQPSNSSFLLQQEVLVVQFSANPNFQQYWS